MRFSISAATVMAAALLSFGYDAGAHRLDHKNTPGSCDSQPVKFHVHRAKALFEQAYALERWEAGPKRSAIRAAQEHKRCIAIPTVRDRLSEFRSARKVELREYAKQREVTPFPGPGDTWWAIPAYIVACESGYDYTPDAGLTFGGAYGILVSTWHSYGGGRFASQANYAEPYHQDLVAGRIWADVGPSAWACA